MRQYNEYVSSLDESEHKKSKEYKKLSPKMKKAVDDLFRTSDSLDKIDTNIARVVKKYGVNKDKIMDYLERETLR
jgi:predicted  nucleic acid-binding Zn-ribbon protein